MVTRILFENMWLLLSVWIPVQFTLIAMWSWMRSTITKRLVWTGFAALPVLLAISMTVVTDREKIIDQLNALAQAVERADIDEIALYFAEEFESHGYTRLQMLKRIDSRLTHYSASHVRISQVEVEIGDEETIVKFRASANIRSPEIPFKFGTRLWKSKWRRSENNWIMTSLEQP